MLTLRGVKGEKVLQLRECWMGLVVERDPGLQGLPASSGIKVSKEDDAEGEDDEIEVARFDENGELQALGNPVFLLFWGWGGGRRPEAL